MIAKKFIEKYMPFAKEAEAVSGVPYIAILAQAALESGWGKKAIGNNVFGVKYRQGDWGKQEVLTTEYFQHKRDFDRKKCIVSKNYIPDLNMFRVVLRAEFADYETPLDAFLQHSKLLLTERYHKCLAYQKDPAKYLECIWRAGYATDPNYGEKMKKMVHSVQKRIAKMK